MGREAWGLGLTMFLWDQLTTSTFATKFDQLMVVDSGKGKGKGKNAGGQPKGKGKGGKGGIPQPAPKDPLPLRDASLEEQFELAANKTRQMISALGSRAQACKEVLASFKCHPLRSKALAWSLPDKINHIEAHIKLLKMLLLEQKAPTVNKVEMLKSKVLESGICSALQGGWRLDQEDQAPDERR